MQAGTETGMSGTGAVALRVATGLRGWNWEWGVGDSSGHGAEAQDFFGCGILAGSMFYGVTRRRLWFGGKKMGAGCFLGSLCLS